MLSKVLDWEDRSTAVLFGDGAGGVLLEATNHQHLLKESLQSDGTRGLSLTSGFVENKNPYGSSSTQYSACMQMVGREFLILRHAMSFNPFMQSVSMIGRLLLVASGQIPES